MKLARPAHAKQHLYCDVDADIKKNLNYLSNSLKRYYISVHIVDRLSWRSSHARNMIMSIWVKDISIFDDFTKINLINRNSDYDIVGHVSVIARYRLQKFLLEIWITKRLLSLFRLQGSDNPMVREIFPQRLIIPHIQWFRFYISPFVFDDYTLNTPTTDLSLNSQLNWPMAETIRRIYHQLKIHK